MLDSENGFVLQKFVQSLVNFFLNFVIYITFIRLREQIYINVFVASSIMNIYASRRSARAIEISYFSPSDKLSPNPAIPVLSFYFSNTGIQN